MKTLTVIVPYTKPEMARRAISSIDDLKDIEILPIADGTFQGALPGSLELPWNTLKHCGISTPGGIPRAVGSLIATTPWVTYLDQDNVWRPGYATVLSQRLNTVSPDVLYLWARRAMYDPYDGSYICDDTFESIDTFMLDTNCMVIRTGLFRPYAASWATPTAYGDDRAVWSMLKFLKDELQMYSECVGPDTWIDYTVNEKNVDALRAYLAKHG